MAFSSIMTFICVGYVLAYGGMVIYDLFLAKEPVELAPKVEEEEIDISDEAKTFNPVIIDKEGRFHWEQDNDQNEEQEDTEAKDVSEEQPKEKSEEKSEQTEKESDVKTERETEAETHQQSEEEAEFPDEIVSASEIEATAREQAQTWMYAQVGGMVDTEDKTETETTVDVESDETAQPKPQPETSQEVLPEAESETGTYSGSADETLTLPVESPDSPSVSLSAESQQTAAQDEEPLIETGAIEMSELAGLLDVLAEKGADSPLGRIIHIWNVEAA